MLVLPKQHVKHIYEADDLIGSKLLHLTARVAAAVKRVFGCSGILIWQAMGRRLVRLYRTCISMCFQDMRVTAGIYWVAGSLLMHNLKHWRNPP